VVGKEQNCVIGAFLTFSSVLFQKGFPRDCAFLIYWL
jgi:hypothetical protein